MTEHQRRKPDNRPPNDPAEEIRALHGRVAELERANAEHRELSEAYRSLVDNAAQGLVILQDGRVAFANRAMVHLTGYSVEEMKAMPADDVRDLVHPDDRDVVWQRHRDRLEGEVREAPDEFRFLRKDGAVRWFQFCASRITYQGRRAVQGAYFDVTERKRAEEALRLSQEKLAAIFESTPVMMIVVDQDRRVRNANRAALEATGHSAEQIQGLRGGDAVRCVHSLDHPDGCGFGPLCEHCVIRRLVADTLATGQPHRQVNATVPTMSTQGPSARSFEVSTARVDAPGSVLTLVCLQDVTEQRQAQERIKQREAELLHVSRLSALGEMAAGLAHELNQPLSAILNYSAACTQLASAGRPDVSRIARNVHKITGQAERARDVMGRMRAFAQRRQPRLTSVDLNEALAGAVDLCSWEMRQAGVAVDLELADDLPRVRADIIQIEQILLNLARNAMEAMRDVVPESRRLTVRTGTGAADTVRVEVSDTGVGLPPQEADRVFEAFFTTKADGLGIGLSISRTIVEMHNGALEARPNAGPGATFVLVLPALAAGADDGESQGRR